MAGWGPFRRESSAGSDVQRRTASPKALRRERRLLLREREERIRDLGGLVFEMFRRDRFRVELVTQRCSELMALEERLDELAALISSAGGRARVRRAGRVGDTLLRQLRSPGRPATRCLLRTLRISPPGERAVLRTLRKPSRFRPARAAGRHPA